jgi:hypothetical protein
LQGVFSALPVGLEPQANRGASDPEDFRRLGLGHIAIEHRMDGLAPDGVLGRTRPFSSVVDFHVGTIADSKTIVKYFLL